MATPTIAPAGWYLDPTRRHQNRYWNGTEWTDQVADGGVTATDSPQLQPPAPTKEHVGYLAVAVPVTRVAALMIAQIATALALLFEVLASVVLNGQTRGGVVPTRATLEWSSWLYHYTPGVVVYGYPPIALWIALLVALILPDNARLAPLAALRKAGCRARSVSSTSAERARLAQALRGIGCAATLLRTRGRRGLVVASGLAAVAVTGVSTYAMVTGQGVLSESGPFNRFVGDLSVGLGPKVCLVAGIVGVVAALVAWPWTTERRVRVFPDGSIRVEPTDSED